MTTTLEDNKLERLKKSLEQKGMDNVKELFNAKSVNASSTGAVLNALSSGTITENNLMNIMQEGVDTFKKEMGRTMTYGEMREMYG